MRVRYHRDHGLLIIDAPLFVRAFVAGLHAAPAWLVFACLASAIYEVL